MLESEFPITANTITIATSAVANVQSTTATVNLFIVLNQSALSDSYVGIFDTQAAAAAATLEEQFHLEPDEQLIFPSPFVSNVEPGVSRTVYAVASTPVQHPDEAPGVIITPLES